MDAKFNSTRLKTDSPKFRYRRSPASSVPKLKVHFIVIVVPFVLFALLLGTTLTLADSWAKTDEGHGTVHEQLGQVHYPTADLTPYESDVKYNEEKPPSNWLMKPAYNVSHSLFKGFGSLPKGYLAVRDGNTLILGPKVEENDWSALLAEYLLVFLWVILLLIIIILLPFIAVCYCCFCCCRRCRMGCGPCDGPKDRRMSLICAIILLLLILAICFGAIVAFASNRVLDRGLDDTTGTMRRSSEDTCRYLKDVNAHVNHIFVYNYEELEAHLDDLLNNAYHHIFLDLSDTSESNAIEQLERIFDNMNEARALMKQVDKLEKDLRFYTTQLRDGVRGAKRDVNYVCSNLVTQGKCRKFLMDSEIEFVDMFTCLHLDNMPDTNVSIEAINQIISEDVAIIPKLALQRFQEIGLKIQQALNLVTPGIMKDVKEGREKFRYEAARVVNKSEELISYIQVNTMRSTQSFEDVYEKFGTHRSIINSVVCGILLLIVIVFLIALLCGCLRSRGTGATCLFFGIMLIFIAVSFITLVGLFYFIMGLITYKGACGAVRDMDNNAIFKELDPQVYGEDENDKSPLRMSTAIKACRANESIFDLLREYKVYDLDNVRGIPVVTYSTDEDGKDMTFSEDLSGTFLLTDEEKQKLEMARKGSLAPYNSILYLRSMCQVLTPNLVTLSTGLRGVRDDIAYNEKWEDYNRYARTALSNEAYHLDAYNYEWTDKILSTMAKMKEKLSRVDDLILYERRTYGNSVKVLVDAIVRSEEFLKTRGSEFINSLSENLTDVVEEQIDTFKEGIITECNDRVGRCKKLAHIYDRGVDLVCYRLADPMNGFWVGLLPAALLLLPLLFVAHKLMCLWRRIHAYTVPVVPAPNLSTCPACSGGPYIPPPIITCGGGQQAYCVCRDGDKRTDGGAGQYDSSSIATSDQNVTVEAVSSTAVNEVQDGVDVSGKPKND